MDRPRLCDRPGCAGPACASLTFDYRGRRAWLDDLDEPHPTRFELCQRHADRVGVPLGWDYDDRRGGRGSVHPLGDPQADEYPGRMLAPGRRAAAS